ncbi:metallophosphoesterase family protein [Pseudodesulfovibrio pelocollis]|uniref:metallophosphoesterase family protein n=1 Tax=Pseudodesulfovibrio pelocollis TaxID=3051432 RepID=UPI00255AC770|nr:metallophosphoesterase family protein [Pseudodesulfovibrio sp. SB368]
MPRLAIMSDPHANVAALTRVLADVVDQGADATYCLGDAIGYGPQPQECCDLLREARVTLLMGNHEQGLINIHYLRGFNQPAADVLRRTRELIDETTYQWLISRPKGLVAHGCRMVHGTPPDSVSEYLWRHETNMGEIFARYPEEFCFVGHTHDLMRFTYQPGIGASPRLALPPGETVLEPGLRHLINVGAVGQPRDGDNRAKYVLFDTATRTVTLRRVPYDIAATVALIEARGFPRAFADRLW